MNSGSILQRQPAQKDTHNSLPGFTDALSFPRPRPRPRLYKTIVGTGRLEEPIGYAVLQFQVHGRSLQTVRVSGPPDYLKTRGRKLIDRYRRGKFMGRHEWEQCVFPNVSGLLDLLARDYYHWRCEQIQKGYGTEWGNL